MTSAGSRRKVIRRNKTRGRRGEDHTEEEERAARGKIGGGKEETER